MQPPVQPAETPGVQLAETPDVQPAETPGVQPAETSEVPHVEISPPAPETPIKWSFPGLDKEMNGKWIDDRTIEIEGEKYNVKIEGGKFYIEVGVDTNYDGLADPGEKALINVETGRGVFKGKTVYAFDKGERFELVARSHAMVDVNGDGEVESAFWIDNKGVCHLSHDLNPKGLEIEGQSYNDWYNADIADKTPDELQRLNIFDLKVEFKNFVPHDNVNLNDPTAIAKDLARQIAAVESSNYHLGEKGALILEEKRFKISQEVIAEELGKKFQDRSFFEKVRDNGLALEEWQKLRPEINKAVEDRLLSIATQLEEKIPSERKIISGVEQAKTHFETSSLKPEIPGLSSETRNYLETLIAEEKDISEKVSELLERVRSGKLTVEEFSRYYAFKLGVREFSPEMISNLNNNFEMAVRGTGEEKLRALRALEIILIRLSLEEK